MFKRIPILNIDVIINKAFSRSASIVLKKKGPKNILFKKKEMEKVSRSAQIIASSLEKVLDRYPNLHELDPFTKEMIHILADINELKEDMGALRWAIKSIYKVKMNSLSKMEKTKDRDKLIIYRKDAYGKYSSILKNISKNIERINDTRNKLIEIPPISSDDYTIVIAGYPNVGKSSLLSKLTTSKPKIASYPFTTTGINIGTFEFKYQRIYVIDTPGLLDRPLSERNVIERKAISAIGYLANIIIYVIDPSMEKRYSIKEQLSLLGEIKKVINIPILTVQNKIDLEHDHIVSDLSLSARTGDGLELLKERIQSVILTDPSFKETKKLHIE